MFGGEGNSYDFGARLYNPRIGRWMATDPLAIEYPQLSPYNFSNNSPLVYKDPDGRDIIVAVVHATTPDYSGHAAIYVTHYEPVIVTVIENNREVHRTYYRATGFTSIENWPRGRGSATIYEEHSFSESGDILGKSAVNFVVQKDESTLNANDFDLNLNPNLSPGEKLYTFDQVKDEMKIEDKGFELSIIPTPPGEYNPNYYTHGSGCSNQNDCSSLPVKMLELIGLVEEGSGFGVTSTTADDGTRLEFYTPNQIGIDLYKRGFPAWTGHADNAEEITVPNAEQYVKNEYESQP